MNILSLSSEEMVEKKIRFMGLLHLVPLITLNALWVGHLGADRGKNILIFLNTSSISKVGTTSSVYP